MCYGVSSKNTTSMNWIIRTVAANSPVSLAPRPTASCTSPCPVLFALFTRRWARYRQAAALSGADARMSRVSSSRPLAAMCRTWSLRKACFAALGMCALVYSPITLSLGEWFNTQKPHLQPRSRIRHHSVNQEHRRIDMSRSCFRGLLDRYGFRTTTPRLGGHLSGRHIRSCPSPLVQTPQLKASRAESARPQDPMALPAPPDLLGATATATLLQSAGYGIPQTYLTEYARNVSALSPTFSTLLHHAHQHPRHLLVRPSSATSATTSTSASPHPAVTAISARSSALGTFVFWGSRGAR